MLMHSIQTPADPVADGLTLMPGLVGVLLRTFSWLPVHFSARYQGLLAGPFTQEGRRAAVQEADIHGARGFPFGAY